MESFHFRATEAGADRYISEVAGDDKAGMWGLFNVTAAPAVADDLVAGAPGTASAPVGSVPAARAAA